MRESERGRGLEERGVERKRERMSVIEREIERERVGIDRQRQRKGCMRFNHSHRFS